MNKTTVRAPPEEAQELILLAVALVVNNLPASRRYPETWF